MLARLQKIIPGLFYLLFFLVPLVFFPKTSELFEFNKLILTYALTSAIAGAWVIKMILEKRVIFRRTALDIPLLIFLASQLLSTLTSIDFRTSFLGYYSRFHGGFLSLLTYSILYWAYVSNMNKKSTFKTIYVLLGSAFVVSIYGVLQHFGIDKEVWVQDVQNRVFSSLGQPNWLAAWLVALVPLTWALALKSNFQFKSAKPWLWVGLSTLFFLVLLYSGSRSGILGFGGSYIIFWGVIAIKSLKDKKIIKTRVKIFLILNFAFLIVAGATGSRWTPSIGDLLNKSSPPITSLPSGDEVAWQGPALEIGGSESGDIRKIVWSGAINIWRNYPVLGTGVETYAFSYYNFRPAEHNLVSEWEYLYNKAHNEYLNFAATTGSLGLISYLILITATIFVFLRINGGFLNLALLSGYISILVTNFFGFSVVPVGLQFFLYPAFAVAIARSKKREATREEKISISNPQKLATVIVLLITFYLLLIAGRYWYADFLYARGKLEQDSQNYTEAREILTNATSLSPHEAIYWDELSQSTTKIAQALQEEGEKDLAKKFADSAIAESNRAIELSPANVNLRRSNASMFIKLSAINQNYLVSARDTLDEATKLAPTDAKLFYNLALSYIRTGERQKATEVLEKTIEMKENYGRAWFALALLHIDDGEIDKAREELQFILTYIAPDDQLAKQELEELDSLYPRTE
ncbi:O-antigen ligase family protein [Patescibacteria group bacterium]|nr:O-antigen ligase family protein [Patescibacteria group bacterium]